MKTTPLTTLQGELKEIAREGDVDLLAFLPTEGLFDTEDPPWVRNAILFGLAVRDDILVTGLRLPEWKKPRQFIDIFLDRIAYRIAVKLKEEGYQAAVINSAEPRWGIRKLALAASLGSIGKSGLILTPRFGPRIRFGGVLTDAPLKARIGEKIGDLCTGCNRCVESCPAGALEGGRLERDRCEKYTQSHLQKVSDFGYRHCLVCTRVCPVGKEKRGDGPEG
jgi:ferredoxin